MKKIVVFLAGYFMMIGAVAQDNNNGYASGASGLFPSPNAENLGRYAEFPVSLYTGIPVINIPLYTIKEGNIAVPISLSYHSKGVRVEEQSSWVGLGWSLNAGGVITRAVMGMPDDLNSIATNDGLCSFHQNNSCYNYLNNGQYLENLYNANLDYTNIPDLSYLSSGNRDGEPDKFFFNFNGHSGQFVFDKNGNPSIASDEKLQITYTRDSQTARISSFTVVDQNGYIYTFNAVEFTNVFINTHYTDGSDFLIPEVYEMNDYLNLGWPNPQYNSSWFLTKIQNANKTHEVNFNYVQENLKDFRDFAFEKRNWNNVSNPNSNQKYSSCTYRVDGKRLSSITWSNGSVTFDANHVRQDIGQLAIQDPGTTTNYALTKCSVKDAGNTTIKSFLFNYNYFASPVPSNMSLSQAELTLFKRLKLLSVTEESAITGTAKPPYQFIYDEAYPLPSRTSPYLDYWGFSNANPNGTTYLGDPMMVKQYYYPNDPPDAVSLSRFSLYQRSAHSGEVTYGSYDKSPNFNYMKAGILTRIVYPTKGYTEFEYEANSFYYMNANRTGGGLRIKKTTVHDGIDHGIDMIKTYGYTLNSDTTKTSGLIMYLPFFAKLEGGQSQNHANFYTNSISGLGTTQGGYVGYQEVTVNHNGNGKVWSKYDVPAAFGIVTENPVSGGYIYNRTNAVNTYITWDGVGGGFNTWLASDNYPYAPNPNYEWSQGSLLQEKVYDKNNRLVKQTVNEYTIKDYKKIPAIKSVLLEWQCNGDGTEAGRMYKYAKYYHLSGWKVLNRQTVTDYNPADNTNKLEIISDYLYENSNHYQLTKNTTTDSKGKTYETIYKRARDYTSSTGMILDLNNQHRLNEVIETQTWLQGSPKQLLGASFSAYNDFKTQNGLSSTQSLVQQQYQLETAAPVVQTGFQDTYFSSGLPVLDSRYKLASIFNYDAKDNSTRQSVVAGNLQQHTTNIYGHTKSLVIAQVSNAKETDCGFTSFESDDYLVYGNYAANIQTDGHCGTKSYSIAPNNFGPGRDYMPGADAQNKKFILSCWVKTTASTAGVIGSLVLHTNQTVGSGVVYPNIPSAYVTTSIYNTGGVWKYIEVEIDPKAIKTAGGLPLTTNVGIRSYVWNTGSAVNIQVDDLRFYPKEARMASYTYKPSIGISSMSDENSNCRYYEYDEFGRLKIVKDQDGKILERTDYNYKP